MPDAAHELTPYTTPEAGIRCHALLPCAGTGSRAGTEVPKQYQPILGLPMVLHTLVALRAVTLLDRLVVVAAPGDDFWNTGYPGVTALRCGGSHHYSGAESHICCVTCFMFGMLRRVV